MTPLAMALDTRSTPHATKPISASHGPVETHCGSGQPNPHAVGSDDLATTPSKVTSEMSRCQDYKPTALRWWYHSFLIICLATFLGLTEYAIQTLLATQQEGLESPLWSRSIENHRKDRQSVSYYKKPSYERLARVPSNVTSSQAGAYSVNTGDSLARSYSSSALATPMESVSSGPTSLHALSSIEMRSNGESSYKISVIIASTSSTTPGPYPLTTGTFDTASQKVVSSGPSITSLNLTASSSTTHVTSTALTTDGYLNLGTTTSTVRGPTPSIETSDLSGGFETTIPSLPTPSTGASNTRTSDIPTFTCIGGCAIGGDQITTVTMSDTGAYLHIEPTSYTTTEVVITTTDGGSSTIDPTVDGGYLPLGTTTSSVVNDIDPLPPSATAPIISEGTSSDEKPIPTVVQHTETWGPRETIVEVSSTDSEGRVVAQRITKTFPGGTSVYQSAKTLSPEGHGNIVTVIRQTEVWASRKTTLERTKTDSRGGITIQTITTDGPAETEVLETTVTMRSGESLMAVPRVFTTTRGGVTQVIQTTFVDSEGHTTTSLYTTVVGFESVLATRTHFLFTSLPPGYTVLTLPTAVPATERGVMKIIQTEYTGNDGHVTTSAYTTTLNGISITRTVPLVIATPVIPGHQYVTLSTIVPTTVGGKTKVIETTSTDGLGHPTTVSYITVEGGTQSSTTVWTIVATPTSTSPSSSNGTKDTQSVTVVVYGLGLRDYMLGAFLPTVLAAVVGYPFKLINVNARLMQPFHELATARGRGGAPAEASIFLRFYDWTGAMSLPRSVRLRQPIIVISDLLMLGAALLAPIAAETVSVHVPQGCDLGCHGSLGVTTIPGRVLEALMATMMALLLALIVLLNVFRWETGVSHNPWGIAGIASLCLSPGIRDMIRKIPCNPTGSTNESMILEALAARRYALDEYWISSSRGPDGVRGYGIVVRTGSSDAKKPVKINGRGNRGLCVQKGGKRKSTQPFALLTWWGRCALLFTFACVLIIATYYETTSLDSGFERFMDSRGFGIRFLFTALGVVIGGCMETFFRSVAIILPYQLLSKHALPGERSILLSPPTNAFYGIYSAFRQRSIFLGAVSFATILAELILPVTLSHIPFSHLDTYETQLVCAWLSISILALMILIIVYSFFMRWPNMPVDPRTIAGAMFYVCDSWMLDTMEGATTLGKKQRDSFIYSQKLGYEFAVSKGVSGKERMNVDLSPRSRGGSCDFVG